MMGSKRGSELMCWHTVVADKLARLAVLCIRLWFVLVQWYTGLMCLCSLILHCRCEYSLTIKPSPFVPLCAVYTHIFYAWSQCSHAKQLPTLIPGQSTCALTLPICCYHLLPPLLLSILKPKSDTHFAAIYPSWPCKGVPKAI